MKLSVSTILPCLFALATTALPAQTPIVATEIANGFLRPLYLGSPPGDEDRLFVLEENTGLVKIIKNGQTLATPFLNLGSLISTAGELGLLGCAFHPDYANNGYVYFNYTRPRTGGGNETVVARYTVSGGNPDVADPATAQEVLVFRQTAGNHNAGGMQFGPDGYLYISTGDGGSGNDPSCNAQNLENLLGKMLRIDVDSGSPYAIPPTNPLVAFPALRHEIWSYGLRNPWRWSFDKLTGDMYIGDVGQSSPTGREEISFQPASSTGGENYGWKLQQGTNCYLTGNCFNPPACPNAAFTLPIHEYNTGANCSVIGGYVYRGCAIPGLQGTYFYADYCSGRFWSFRWDGSTMTEFQERTSELFPAGGPGRINSFGEDERGEIYICAQNGRVYQIRADATSPATNLGFGKVGSNGLQPVFEVCGLLGAGQSAEFILRNAPGATTAAFLLGASSSPITFPWGTIVPSAPMIAVPFAVGASGRLQFTVNGGVGPATAVAQWALLDAGASAGLGLSNGVQIDFP